MLAAFFIMPISGGRYEVLNDGRLEGATCCWLVLFDACNSCMRSLGSL